MGVATSSTISNTFTGTKTLASKFSSGAITLNDVATSYGLTTKSMGALNSKIHYDSGGVATTIACSSGNPFSLSALRGKYYNKSTATFPNSSTTARLRVNDDLNSATQMDATTLISNVSATLLPDGSAMTSVSFTVTFTVNIASFYALGTQYRLFNKLIVLNSINIVLWEVGLPPPYIGKTSTGAETQTFSNSYTYNITGTSFVIRAECAGGLIQLGTEYTTGLASVQITGNI